MKNKQILLTLLMLISIGQTVFACCTDICNTSSNCGDCGSHEFVPRSITTDLVYTDALAYYQRNFREKDKTFIFTGTYLYQKSRKACKLGAAFLKGDSNTATVTQAAGGDINSNWLQIANNDVDTPFSATFSLNPERKVFGYHGNWYFNLDSWWCGAWLDVTSAIINATHSLGCCEKDVNAVVPTCPNSTVSDALSRPELRYDKYYCGLCNDEQRRTGIDDIQIRLGYNYTWCDENLVGLYLIGTVPAGRKPTNEFIFEPLVGSKHWSVGFGLNGTYNAWCNDCGDMNVVLMSDFNYRYVLKHDECRTFDLCPNGAFSRFLLVAPSSDTDLALPGVNFFTQNVSVTPRSTIQWWLALNFEYCAWDFEVGYNLYWRQQEKIDCVSSLCADIGIYDINNPSVPRTSLSQATIATAPGEIASDPSFVSLTSANFNISSAEAGRVLTNKFYGALSWNGDVCGCIDWMAGAGASYEFVSGSSRCNALPFWGVFGKGGIAF